MRENDFSDEVKKATLARANFRCERCWRSGGLEFHHIIPISTGGDYGLKNCVILCHECHRLAPSDPFLLRQLFLRFASIKEMIQYYKVKSEQEAFEKWKIETGFIEKSIPPHNHSALVKRKMEEKAKEGKYLGFGHPYGYDYKDNKLTVNVVEAPIVKKIYDLYLRGNSVSKIVSYLNNSKILTKKGKKWADNTVAKILKNPLYCGYIKWDGIIKEGKHESIIDKNTFLVVQTAFGSSRSGKPYMPSKAADATEIFDVR
jgi:hypothetical protein